jgi:16S rRNA (guanine527-N7)-methyltransferase
VISPSAEELLGRYERLLRAWAPRLDLISPGDVRRIRERHIDDSLKALPLLSDLPEGECIDVGSGAGLPGIPLAIAGPERLHWRLLEPRRRRSAFLEETVRELGLDCEVIVATAEEAAKDERLAESHVLATARALSPPLEAFGLLRPLLGDGGVAAVFVGDSAELPQGTATRMGGLATMRKVSRPPQGGR